MLEADVSCDGHCRLSATVEHTDEGRDHYADKWEILDADGGIIAVHGYGGKEIAVDLPPR